MSEEMSLAKTATMSLQEIFDFAVNHLRKQASPSVGSTGRTCLYRGPLGKKCAAGAFISDAEYTDTMEGMTIGTLLALFEIDMDEKRDRLLRSLQNAHDDTAFKCLDNELLSFMDLLESGLQKCAATHKLVYTKPEGGV